MAVQRQWILVWIMVVAGLQARARPGEELWHWTTGAGILSSPAIGPDGTVYFGADDGNLYAVSSSGRGRWLFPTYQILEASPAIGKDGTIYFGSTIGVFYAINPDGRKRVLRPSHRPRRHDLLRFDGRKHLRIE